MIAMQPELDAYINKVKNLPPAPRVLPQLLEALGQPDVDSNRVVTLIAYDPSLTANVLALCNSAYFGGAEPATDLLDAITRVGFNNVYQLITVLSGRRCLTVKQAGCAVDEGALWRHSVTAAVAAQLIAHDRGADENLVFTATLLHDLGKIILAQALEPVYSNTVKAAEEQQQSLLQAEKKMLGVQHAEIGGRLLARWKFPANLIAAVWFHHTPKAAQPHHRLAAFVYLGNLIAHFMDRGYGQSPVSQRDRRDAQQILTVPDEDIPFYMTRTFQRVEKVEAMFKLNDPVPNGSPRPMAGVAAN